MTGMTANPVARSLCAFLRILPASTRILAGLVAAVALLGQAQAQPAWPAKPIRIIVPFAAGAFTDIAARTVAIELSTQLGQPVLVENRGGAGSTLGTDAVAKAAPDGYTLVVTDNSFVISPSVYTKLPYDPLKDLAPISLIAETPAIWTVRADLPARSVSELVALARANPGMLTFGSGGVGSSAHLATQLFLDQNKIEMTHVPFKGVAAALAEAAAGRIDVTVSSTGGAIPHIRSSRLRALALTGGARDAQLADVPTFAEAGFPNYRMVYWFMLAAPTGTPPAVITRLYQEVVRATQATRVREAFAAAAARPVSTPPAELAKRLEEEIATWKAVVVKAGVKPE
ncbi:MAG: tripartite tricarboxylate transporter substrate binding protein [Betaproteobacteria bacterium]